MSISLLKSHTIVITFFADLRIYSKLLCLSARLSSYLVQESKRVNLYTVADQPQQPENWWGEWNSNHNHLGFKMFWLHMYDPLKHGQTDIQSKPSVTGRAQQICAVRGRKYINIWEWKKNLMMMIYLPIICFYIKTFEHFCSLFKTRNRFLWNDLTNLVIKELWRIYRGRIQLNNKLYYQRWQ